jgi:hypothetical protein
LVDASIRGIHTLPDLPNPIVIEVKLGENARFDFILTEAVTIKGRINLELDGSELSINQKSIGPVMLEVSNGSEVHRRITDETNKFDFSHLRPGHWKLTIVNAETYNGFSFEKASYDFELKPGEKVEFPINTTHKKRAIRFQTDLTGLQKD